MDMEMDPDVLVCPSCGSEFQLHVTHCIDCGAPTRPAAWVDRRPKPNEPPPFFSLSREAEARILRDDDFDGVQSLGVFLEENGVPCRIESLERMGRHLRYAVCVAESDYDRATELDREHFRRRVPDVDPSFGHLPATDQCPACGSRLTSHDVECPGCGLVVGDADEESAES